MLLPTRPWWIALQGCSTPLSPQLVPTTRCINSRPISPTLPVRKPSKLGRAARDITFTPAPSTMSTTHRQRSRETSTQLETPARERICTGYPSLLPQPCQLLLPLLPALAPAERWGGHLP